MQKIMAVNAGSSSIKFQLLEMPAENVICSGLVERIGLDNAGFTLKYNGLKEEKVLPIKDHSVGVQLVLDALIEKQIVKNLEEIEGVGHRVVQGGEYFQDSCEVTEETVQKILELADLAPLHNPHHVTGIRAFQKVLPNVFQVVVFDTTFHQTLEEEAYMYAIPYHWYKEYKIRKYGAHGTSHKFVSQECAKELGKDLKDTKIIVCHIGNGASICAVEGGKSKDTSMGLTPLEGIPMGTRTGNIDPSVVEYICNKENKTPAEVLQILNKKSGYLGFSERSHDARDLTKGMKEGDHKCKLTFDIQAKRVVDYIGSYYFYMQGCDAICFTAGIGENVGHLRENICNRLEFLGVKINKELNLTIFGEKTLISTEDSSIKVYVMPTNEEVMIARDVVRLKK
jgi:acetate kinase